MLARTISFLTLLFCLQSIGALNKLVCEYETINIECLEDQIISIKSVEFGRKNAVFCNNNLWTSKVTNCTSKSESFRAVYNRCQYKRSCSVNADVSILGDPCAQIAKYLNIDYNCVKGNLRTSTACEGETMKLQCTNGQRIATNEATFGRMKPNPCYVPGAVANTLTCQSSTANGLVASRCDGRPSCSIDSNVQTFGDPCPRIPKYLEVKYSCV
ncbi:protein Hydra magnipapillata [Nesidiocoris tenuis]|uniref:Protein Hydra magnipapillata n=1 Tax=Nesidiocoris tenuis TaxID=355587 RepID=A0ABN7AVI1_9HEMI|nr:protein Hydra magnipapillata [Nesidiocoris tenuis]